MDLQKRKVKIKTINGIQYMYLGGKNLFYFDDKIPEIDVELVLMNMGLCLKDRFGANNYAREIEKFSKNTGLAMDTSTTFAVTSYHSKDEFIHENFSPTDTIIIRNREIFSKAYRLIFSDTAQIGNRDRRNTKSTCTENENSKKHQC